MKSTLLILLLACLPLCAADFSGKWAGNYDVAMADGSTLKGKVTLTLEQNGSEITGTAGSDQGNMKIVNGKVEGENITFEIQTQDGPKIRFDLHVEEDHLRGQGKGDGDDVHVKLDVART